MPSERRKLEDAITALEAQRKTLGDEAVDTAIASMREKLAHLRQPASSPGYQRKQVTVLFGDLVGFTPIAEALDPEEVRDLQERYFGIWRAAIEKHGGVVEKFIGDAVMGIFGVPQATEDDPEMAIRAGLEMHIGLKALNDFLSTKPGSPTLQMRVGIHTGLVIVSGSGQDVVATGDTVNLTARLQANCPAGGTLISHDTYRHVMGVFLIHQQNPIIPKGKSTPVDVYLVEQAKTRAFRLNARLVGGVETRMIGRDAELGQMQRLLDHVRDIAYGQAVTVIGEAGVGKTRLLHEFQKGLELLPYDVWYFKGQSSERLMSVPYSLFRDVFNYRFEILDSDAADVARAKLVAGIQMFTGPGREMEAHFIGHLLGFDFSQSPHVKPLLQDSQQIHDRAVHYLMQFFHAVYELDSAPTVLLLEDVHWADDKSHELIQRIAQKCYDIPLMIVCLARITLLEQRPEWEKAFPAHVHIRLRALSADDTGKLVEEVLQRVSKLPPDLRDGLVTRSEGNPFYIEELVRMLLEDGVLVTGPDEWQVVPERLKKVRFPSTLTGVLQARLDSLPPDEINVLQRAAVVGRLFWEDTLRHLDIEAGVDVSKALKALTEREIIRRRSASAFQDTGEYSFKHAILHEVTYESVLKKRRLVYHDRAGDWLEHQHSDRVNEHAALIAYHYEMADNLGKALEYLHRAGERASAIKGARHAAEYFERALALASGKGASSLTNAAQWQSLLNYHVAKEYEILGEMIKSLQYYDISIEIAERVTNQEGVARGNAGKGELLDTLGNYDDAVVSLNKALEMATAIEDEYLECRILSALGGVAFSQQRLEDADGYLDKAIKLARELNETRRVGQSLARMGMVAFSRQDFHAMLDFFKQSMAAYESIGDKSEIAHAISNRGAAYYMLGDLKKAQGEYLAALDLAREIGSESGASLAINNIAEVSFDLGDYATSEEYVLEGLRRNLKNRTLRDLTYILFGYSRLRLHEGKVEEAVESLSLARHHPSARADLFGSSDGFWADLQAKLPPAELEAAVERGKALDLETYVESILAETPVTQS